MCRRKAKGIGIVRRNDDRGTWRRTKRSIAPGRANGCGQKSHGRIGERCQNLPASYTPPRRTVWVLLQVTTGAMSSTAAINEIPLKRVSLRPGNIPQGNQEWNVHPIPFRPGPSDGRWRAMKLVQSPLTGWFRRLRSALSELEWMCTFRFISVKQQCSWLTVWYSTGWIATWLITDFDVDLVIQKNVGMARRF